MCCAQFYAACFRYNIRHYEYDNNNLETLLDLEDHEAGADQGEIDALPEVQLDETIDEYECPVCMEKMATNDIVRTLPCFHRLHKECIDKWLEVRKTCPICKTSVGGVGDEDA